MVQLMKKIKQTIINVPDVEVTINWNKYCVLTLLILGILAASLGKGIYLYINTFILFLFYVLYVLIEFNDNNDFGTSCSALRQSIFFWYCIYGVLNYIICKFLIDYNNINIFIICETVALIIISIVVLIIVLISNYKNSQRTVQQNYAKQTKIIIVFGNIFLILASISMLIAVNLKGLIGLLYCCILWVATPLMVILLLPIQMAIANCIKYKIIAKEKPTQ